MLSASTNWPTGSPGSGRASGEFVRLVEPAPVCLRGWNGPARVEDAEILTAAAAHALAWISFSSRRLFTGPPCRPQWRFPAPEIHLGEESPVSFDPRSSLYAVASTLLAASRPEGVEIFAADDAALYTQWVLDDGPSRAWRAHAALPGPLREFFASACARSRNGRPDPGSWPGELRLLWPEESRFSFPRFPVVQRVVWLAALRAGWAHLGVWRWWIAAAVTCCALGLLWHFR